MSKDKAASSMGLNLILSEFLSTGLYKRSQGRLARQITCVVIWVVVAFGAWRLAEAGLQGQQNAVRYGIASAVLLAGLWIGYRLVNYPPFADFLIAVEAEMNKVSWPTWRELSRSTTVVIVLIIGLTAVLFALDAAWLGILTALGVAKG
ncbi:preprotein translocase subunit SecE [Anatilimnocola aggregata]|uniref:Protein translocase subunit SecE n=1 Tax=Anatilimnocola aggregata TaxID=2528021 RepID=A0A517YJU5_9BACT|nr:preprotein translocase subunit SecE [Anatilimnocola aggregata]QDU30498.1 preprotein translocase subunit SecE [Anatilimnocola aggregata]